MASAPLLSRSLALLLLLALLGGCAASNVKSAAWADGPAHGQTLATPHYTLHTTIADGSFLRDLAATMEESHKLYARLVPLPPRGRPLVGYVFAYRNEWVDYTQRTAGPLATTYLMIHRGGYAHEDVFATFYHGGPQTLAVCRHEGLHQYIAAGFKQRPPAFLEEGLATLFEEGFENNNIAQPHMNATRQNRLAEAVRRKRAWPLRDLLTKHAGNVIGQDGPQIDTFYAQAWALARFLVADERYRDGFGRMLAAYADGSVGRLTLPQAFERYLNVPFAQLERDYEAYVRALTGT